MATLAGNNAKLVLDGVDVSAYAIEASMSPGGSSNEITSGFGTDWVQRSPGLRDMSFTARLAYNTANISTYIQKLQPQQAYVVEFYPENETSGKPLFKQSMILESGGGPGVQVSKEMTVFELTFNGADAPTDNMFEGDTV